MTLGKVAPPRYAHFISRYKDDPDPSVRRRQRGAEALRVRGTSRRSCAGA